jgi:hypothetical protein
LQDFRPLPGSPYRRPARRSSALRLVWPAAVLFVPPGALLAGIVQHVLADVLPDGLPTIETNSIGSLNFDDSAAAPARHPQQVLPDFGEPLRPDPRAGRSVVGRNIAQKRFPVFRGISRPGVGAGGGFVPTWAASFSICLGVGIRQLAGRSLMSGIRT